MRSIKYECLNRVIPIGERHLRRTIAEDVAHYNRVRVRLTNETPRVPSLPNGETRALYRPPPRTRTWWAPSTRRTVRAGPREHPAAAAIGPGDAVLAALRDNRRDSFVPPID